MFKDQYNFLCSLSFLRKIRWNTFRYKQYDLLVTSHQIHIAELDAQGWRKGNISFEDFFYSLDLEHKKEIAFHLDKKHFFKF